MDPIVTEVAVGVLKRERRLRIIRGAATICYMGVALTAMLFLMVLVLGSLGAHSTLSGHAIEALWNFADWPLFVQIVVPVGGTIAFVDCILRHKRAYRYL